MNTDFLSVSDNMVVDLFLLSISEWKNDYNNDNQRTVFELHLFYCGKLLSNRYTVHIM